MSWVDRMADAIFLSRRHIDWSRTRAYAQGNFGQIFVNQRGRQPHGCVARECQRAPQSEMGWPGWTSTQSLILVSRCFP